MKSIACFLLIWTALIPLAAADEPTVDYTRDVKPLLAAHCVRCHGASKPKARLRLDTAKGLLAGGTNGPAAIAGNAEESLIVLALLGEGDGDRMPFKKPPLKAAEIKSIRRWIDAGAEAPLDEKPSTPLVHWAFVPPTRVEPPAVRQTSWVRNPIDQFLLARMEKAGVAPSPEADRATLIRRACLDLLGMPPTPEEVESFVLDNRADAYERMIERLLASPHYGERWARLWLDGRATPTRMDTA